MNERIKQLAKEAGVWRQHYDIGEESPAGLEKFAELIVRECARIGELKEQGYSQYDSDTSVGWYMKEHFGVDE